MIRNIVLTLFVLLIIAHFSARLSVLRDVQAMGRVVQALPPRDAIVHGLPIQIGAHYGYLPILPTRGRCYVDPVWIWRRGLPVDAAGSQRMVTHPTMGTHAGALGPCR